MGLFGKKQVEQPVDTRKAIDKMVMKNLIDSGEAQSLADSLLNGCPLCIGFGELDIDEANKVIAFLTGVTYAIGGTTKMLNDNIFMFASKENFFDDSLNEFLKNYESRKIK